jgi:CRP/FNR family transcriptional regulator, anaerobic regulatory protein
MTDELQQSLMALYPAINAIDESERSQVLRRSVHLAQVPAGTVLFDEGSTCQGFPLVLAGEVRVARGNPAGRQLELYRVTVGELCVVSTSCLFSHRPRTTRRHCVLSAQRRHTVRNTS